MPKKTIMGRNRRDFRLSDEADEALVLLARRKEMTMTAFVEMLILEYQQDKKLLDQIKDIVNAALQNVNITQPTTVGPKPLTIGHAIEMPTFDDDDESVVVQKDTNADTDINNSFLNAVFNIQKIVQ